MKTNKEMIEEAVANIHKGELLIPEERKEYNTEILTTLLTKHEEAVVERIASVIQDTILSPSPIEPIKKGGVRRDEMLWKQYRCGFAKAKQIIRKALTTNPTSNK